MAKAKKKKYSASDSHFRNRIRTSGCICTFHSGSAFICCDRILYGSECAEQPGDQL